jgi:hypothetical protein
VAVSCEHGNEPTGSVKCWEFPNFQLFDKDSGPLTSLPLIA